MIAVDTNVLLYSVDWNEPVKQLKAQKLLHDLRAATEPTVLLWQVLGEFANQLCRWRNSGKLTLPDFNYHLNAFRHIYPLCVPTADAFDRALRLAERFYLSHWDSMLLGACQAAGVTRLYTEDIGAPRVIDGIALVNPFA